MERIEDILNTLGDFSCYISDRVASFPGVLNSTKGDICLLCKMSIDWYQQIDKYSPLYMWGNINGIPVTLLHVYLKSGTHRGEEDSISLVFYPAEILIGQSCSEKTQVSNISVSIPELNYMFSSPPLQPEGHLSIEHPSVLKYTFPKSIETDDKYGHLRVYQTFKEEWSRSGMSYKFLPIIEYRFNRPMEVMDAVAKIAAVKNLFTFFANHELPFEDITIKSLETKSEPYQTSRDCILYLNHRESILTPHEPFLITTAAFSEKFKMIWNRWLQIYEEATYISVLFYEIICNRSTRVNRFLNLSQAIEVYSKHYRKDAVEAVARACEKTAEGKKPPIHLNHRFEDIFLLINPYLEIEKNKISSIARSLADMRNFFTHYDEGKYVEPSYQEMLAACHVLEFVLLAILYHDIGIPAESIKSSKRRAEFQRFDEFLEMLTKNYLKTPKR